MIGSVKDIVDAEQAGRIHVQRFFKNASTTGDTQWIDWSFASGQPAYDARIGDALTLTPYVAERNDAIYFPGKASDQQRVLLEMVFQTTSGGTSQTSVDAVLYDLVAVYPLIDGDSIDDQFMDNTLPLPRYEDGKGLIAVMVNHVAPILTNATGTMEYVDSGDVTQTVSFSVVNTGVNKVVSGSTSNSIGFLSMPMAGGAGGIKQINRITFNSAPGGLFAIYIIRPLSTVTNNDGRAVSGSKVATEKGMYNLQGWAFPEIKDGAWLGFFIRPNGGARTVSMFGNLTFVWG
jgi:hypothetical protein